MIVIDASAAVEHLCRASDRGDWIRNRLQSAATLHVPALFDLEVLHSLRGLEAGGELRGRDVANALTNLADLRATYYHHSPFRRRIWSLRHNLTAYDAAYVALAEALDVPLLTADAPLARSSGHAARIELASSAGHHDAN